MKMKKLISVILSAALLISVISVGIIANAASDLETFTKYTYFVDQIDASQEDYYDTSLVDSDTVNDVIRTTLYMKSIDENNISTFGATLIIDLDVVDTLDSETGHVNTSQFAYEYKKPGTQFYVSQADAQTLYDEGIEDAVMPHSFAGYYCDINGANFNVSQTSITGYKASTNELYVHLSGFSAAGINVANALTEGYGTPVAEMLFALKEGKTFADLEGAIKVMPLADYQKEGNPVWHMRPNLVAQKSGTLYLTANETELYFAQAAEGSVSGSLALQNSSQAITLALTNNDDDTIAYSSSLAGGTASFAIEGVKAGTYTLKVASGGSLGYTVNNIVVTADNDTAVGELALLYGDINEDGKIDSDDMGYILLAANYLAEVGDAANQYADVNGSGKIDSDDMGYIFLASNYLVKAEEQVKSL